MDWGAHACDIIRWLTGAEATLAFAQFASYTDVPPADQSSMALYTLDNGVLVQIWLTYELPPPSLGSAMQMLITGSDGIIEIDAYGTVRLATPGDGLADDLRAAAVRPARRRGFRSGSRRTRRSSATSWPRSPRVGIPSVSGRQGAATTSWLEAAERSAATGESVRLLAHAGSPCDLTAFASCCPRAAHRSGPTSRRRGRRSSRWSATPTGSTTSSSPASTRRTTCTAWTTSAGRPSCTASGTMIKLDQEPRTWLAQRAIGAGFQSVLFADIRTRRRRARVRTGGPSRHADRRWDLRRRRSPQQLLDGRPHPPTTSRRSRRSSSSS